MHCTELRFCKACDANTVYDVVYDGKNKLQSLGCQACLRQLCLEIKAATLCFYAQTSTTSASSPSLPATSAR